MTVTIFQSHGIIIEVTVDMPRGSRIVYPDTPHHIVQRGCRKQDLFFEESDYRIYLEILGVFSRKYNVEIWCYCLMKNHIHLIAFPRDTKSLSKTIGEAHQKYAAYLNKKMEWKGHVWEYRFYSQPMDEIHLFRTVRYILKNSVDAGLVEKAENYDWSNAKSLLTKQETNFLGCLKLLDYMKDWTSFIEQPTEKEIIRSIKSDCPQVTVT